MHKKYGFSDMSYEVARRAKFKCEYCGFNIIESIYAYELFQIDHIMPTSKGGGEFMKNYALSCKLCNRMKKDTVYEVDYSNRSEAISIISEILKNKIHNKVLQLNELKEYAGEIVK